MQGLQHIEPTHTLKASVANCGNLWETAAFEKYNKTFGIQCRVLLNLVFPCVNHRPPVGDGKAEDMGFQMYSKDITF